MDTLMNLTLLDLPYSEIGKFRVRITAKAYGPHAEFPDGDKFVTLESGGESLSIQYRHLKQVVESLVEAQNLLKSCPEIDFLGEVKPYLLCWDSPINKGTLAIEFHNREMAEEYADLNLKSTGWPMNVRIVPKKDMKDPYRIVEI